jgi:HEPN domain-containing protein
MFDKEKTVTYWRSHAAYDLETAESLFASKRYPYCLFMCHLAIEKFLKGIIVEQTSEHAPYTHNLITLCDKAGIEFSPEQKQLIATVNEFNMEARYPDWQDEFYARATKEYTEEFLSKTKEFYLWLENFRRS